MKAKDLLLESGELRHKIRTQDDLINHLGTREDGMSNYSLLLGSGASVTSGIRSASELILEWKKDLYQRLNREDQLSEGDSTPSEIDEFFSIKCASWFNPANPYSSLFEKRYDLPSQRRRFIEKEVDGQLPSIGYAYLTAIIDSGIVNTVFTTNFDDLLNEAFYHFSNKRPIHCAHDSSVHSISITSKRPKIVKLHGDYLFDDIKSTLRETESLEQNIKDKMIEFCKEYGLIVVGYSGSDRSVMDVLDFLIKQDNYLKNGIYWCLRPDDEVNHQLRGLLWKDRVYPVIIDGFDEFFARTHSELVSDYLDVENNIKQSKVRKTIEEIVSDRINLSDDPIISKDIEGIKQINVRSDIGKFIGGPNADRSGMSIYEVRNLMEVDSYIRKGNLAKAYSLCESFRESSPDRYGELRYIKKLIEISDRQGRTETANRWCAELLNIDRFDVNSIILSARFKANLMDRYRYLSSALSEIKHSPSLYEAAANAGFKYLNRDPSSVEVKIPILLDLVNRSIDLDPSVTNDSWSLKYELMTYDQKLSSSEEKHIEDFVNSVWENFPESIRAHRMRGVHVIKVDKVSELKSVLDSLYSMYKVSSLQRKEFIDGSLIFLMNKLIGSELKGDVRGILADFFDSHTVLEEDVNYKLAKASYHLSVNADFNAAKELLDNVKLSGDIGEWASEIFEIDLELAVIKYGKDEYVRNIDIDFYLEALEDYRFSVSEEYYHATRYSFLLHDIARSEEAHKEVDRAYDHGLSLANYIVNKTYLFLKYGQYSYVLDFLKGYDIELKKMGSEDFYPTLINREYSNRKLGFKVDQTALMNVVANAGKDSAKVCALRVLGRDNEAKKLAKHIISFDAKRFAQYRLWPVMEGSFLDEFNPFRSMVAS